MEDMEVDLTFSDITNTDISMREVNRLLNTTESIHNSQEEYAHEQREDVNLNKLHLTQHFEEAESSLTPTNNQFSIEEVKINEGCSKVKVNAHNVNASFNNLINFSMDNSQLGLCNALLGQQTAKLDGTYIRYSECDQEQVDPFEVAETAAQSDENNSNRHDEDEDEHNMPEAVPPNPATGILINFEETFANSIREEVNETRTISLSSDQQIEIEQVVEEEEEEEESAMDGELDKSQLVQELNRLKLELNQVKQEGTTLALQLQKKEEVYLKAEADFQQKETQFNAQIVEQQEQLANIHKDNNNDAKMHDLSKRLEDVKDQLWKSEHEIIHLKKIVKEYELTLCTKNAETDKLNEENVVVNKHLAVLEAAFSDVITKYDRSKDVILGNTRNESILKEKLEKSNEIAEIYEKRYEALKAHANTQMENANKETWALKAQHQQDITKQKSIIKRLTIKVAAMEQIIDQKVAECKALATLCDEMTAGAPK